MCANEYKATFIRATSGDTVELLVDLGFKFRIHWRFKLVGVVHATEEEAKECRFFMEDLLKDKDLTVTSFKLDDYHYSGIIYGAGLPGGLAQTLMENGYGSTEVQLPDRIQERQSSVGVSV